jgi:hypothetical protein
MTGSLLRYTAGTVTCLAVIVAAYVVAVVWRAPDCCPHECGDDES